MENDLERRLMNTVALATVEAVDTGSARIQVRYLNNTSAWLPWVVGRAGGVRHWSAPQVGEQVVVVSPQGDTEWAVCLPSLYKEEYPAPSSDPHEHLSVYEDGAMIGYNDETHHLYATLSEGGTTELVSDGGITLIGDLTVNGNVTHNGTTHSTGTVSSDADIRDASGTLQANRDVFNKHDHIGDSGGVTEPPNQQQ